MGLLARRCLIAAPTRTSGPCPVRNVRRMFSFVSPSIRNMAPRTAGQKPGKLYTPLASTPEVSAAASARTSTYGTRGYNFIEGLSTLSPTAVLGRLKVVVSLYVVVSASVFGAVVWFLTTRSYVLTLDPDPKSDARYKTFSCDYAVIRNRWTGKRHTVDMVPVSAGNAGANVRHRSPMSATAESVEGISTMEKRVKVNWLIYSVQYTSM
uniref:Uncharacterized protein n=1 Tax=Trypanosoma congolense (strain IL3000) TaxID=1068625 RepID=G0UTB6_TRYCI|nr:conserved hypothetical protein [Trypanosoma congolense IL3000]